jgi:hypothetical protein
MVLSNCLTAGGFQARTSLKGSEGQIKLKRLTALGQSAKYGQAFKGHCVLPEELASCNSQNRKWWHLPPKSVLPRDLLVLGVARSSGPPRLECGMSCEAAPLLETLSRCPSTFSGHTAFCALWGHTLREC